MKSKAFRSAFPHTLPVMAGYLFLVWALAYCLKATDILLSGLSLCPSLFMPARAVCGLTDLLCKRCQPDLHRDHDTDDPGTASLLRSFHHRQIQRHRKEKASADP